MTFIERKIAEWKKSTAAARVAALENIHFVRGGGQFYGETIPEFITRALTEQREEIRREISKERIESELTAEERGYNIAITDILALPSLTVEKGDK